MQDSRTRMNVTMTQRMSNRFAFALAGLLVFASTASLRADTDDNAQQAKEEFSQFWNVEMLMDRAAANIARRYNLNETQREQTHEMLTREVTQFLDEHEDIWPLVRDLARYQQMGKQPDGRIAAKLAQKALPLIREIEDTILEANERWRGILTEDQKRVHDFDLEDMARTFAQMNDNYREMSEGGDGDIELWPKPNPGASSIQKPKQPDDGWQPPPPIVEKILPAETAWDSYVREFREDFKLDDSQSEAALSILKECKQRASDYRQSKRREYAQVEEQLRSANRQDLSPDARKAKTRVWYQIEKALNKPILDLFQELKTRLDVIPSDSQRIAARKAGRPFATQRKTRRTTKAPQATSEAAKTDESSEKVATPVKNENPKDASAKKTPVAKKQSKAPARPDAKAAKTEKDEETPAE
jgi:hypothetical protein